MSGSDAEEPARRETYVQHDAVYAAVGASAEADLLRFPPHGSTPFEHSLRLGSGADRFLTAANILMTWGAHRSVGIEVTDVLQGSDERYAGILFDEDGTPEVAPELEVSYGPDGEAFLTAGTTATLRWPSTGAQRNMRVVFVVDEARRAGFALGTADEAGVVGESVYLVEHREDESVWAVARGFYWAPAAGLFGLKARTALRLAAKEAEQLIATLGPGAAAGANAAQASTDPQGD